MKKFILLIFSALIVINLMQSITYADNFQAPTIPKPATLPGPVSNSADQNKNYLTNNLIPTIVKGSLGILGGASLIFLIYGGVQYLMSFQNEEHANNAKNTIIYALAGLMLGILSYSIVNIIGYIDYIDATQRPKNIVVCPVGQVYVITDQKTNAGSCQQASS